MTDPKFEARRMLERVGGMMDQLGDLQLRLREAQATAERADGRVSVTVGPSGALTDVHIDPRAMRLGSEVLAEQILAAAQEATGRVAEEISRMVAEVTGETTSSFGRAATGNLDLFGGRTSDLRLPDSGDPSRDAREIIERSLGALRD